MQNEAARLQCPNEQCKAANNESDKYCQQCGTFIPKLYLWAVGSGIEEYRVGEIAAERYLLKSKRLFLDTKPGLPPETQQYEITTATKPYLRLIPYRLQVPQVYGFLPGQANSDIFLLEAPVYSQATPLAGQLLPTLYDAWQDARHYDNYIGCGKLRNCGNLSAVKESCLVYWIYSYCVWKALWYDYCNCEQIRILNQP
ncbi:hypothetical protein [Gloeocapsopsis sp. IPPAS B-1203]|uniref:hypothetical protein n=1 Tax=Gloeocapsopsis sp. IPPAS B-1203 TaxID=2049454 RepID=UPI0025A309E1|nr:hypothetical protein [Gloeocapsopsis sp. IPPAS B-1203]